MPSVTLTGDQANFLLDVAMAEQPYGVPVPYGDDKDGVAQQLERAGMVVRHYAGKGKGAALTNKGVAILNVMKNSK